MCILAINCSSTVNLVASSATQTLRLTTTQHPTLYTLQWVDCTIELVTCQCMVPFPIHHIYSYNIQYYIVKMTITFF